MIKTIDEKAWMLKGTSFMIGDVPFVPKGETRKLDINTHLPFVFLPDKDWVTFSELMKKNYPDIICIQEVNVCYFQKRCSEISYNN
jgi:hypothetical protein